LSDRHTNAVARSVEDTRPAEDAHAIIVAAAQALYRSGGADAVTMRAVARQANCARGVVYNHFTNRQDLLAAASRSPEPAEERQPAAPAAPVDNYDELARAQAEALQELSKQVMVAKPRQRDAAEQALSRLDVRLSITEKNLTALEQRVGDRMKSLDVDVSSVAERLHGLRQRLDKFEEKQTAALAQLRFDVHNLAPNPAHVAVAVAEPVADSVPDVAPVPEQQTAEALTIASEPDGQIATARMADYLLSARRAAIDAGRMAAQPVKRKSVWQRIVGKRHWVILAVAAVLVIWFDVYVFAHYQPALGSAAPVAAQPVIVPAPKVRAEWSPHAQLVRGLKYLNGTGVPVDLAMARLWIERAALRDQPVAQNLMGVFYQTGTGVTANLPVAIGWYEGAAEHGNLKAMTNLGKLYAGGWPQGTDFVKAAGWFAKAAAGGEGDAQFDLAVLYERGAGVPHNVMQAYKWYAISGASGDTHAATRAATLAAELTVEERQAADAAVAAFKPTASDKEANESPQVSG